MSTARNMMRAPVSAAAGQTTRFRILALDPGSTATKAAVFVADQAVDTVCLPHERVAGTPDDSPTSLAARLAALTDWLATLPSQRLDAVTARGGLLRPIPSGVYEVSDAVLADLRSGLRGHHAANLGGQLARAIADAYAAPAFVVDPVSVDEFDPVARVAGLADLQRVSALHALNVRAVARRYCAERGRPFERTNLVVAHLGSGISVVAVADGRLVDANNANEEGPFSPERTGGLPCGQLADLILAGRVPDPDAFLHHSGGLLAYLGTPSLAEVERRIVAGDCAAARTLDAMAYQIGKAIGAYATVLSGRVDAVLLTGGGAHCRTLVDGIRPLVAWIAPLKVYPGEDELAALVAGATRVLSGCERARDYAEAACLDCTEVPA